jgi:coenzyme F420-0:L-glutamate ligase / coenzyme F420-1:gamma-L-glutamate ligase
MSAPARRLSLFAPDSVPEITAGADLAAICLQAVHDLGEAVETGDILVFAQKVVSKAEGRAIALTSVSPGADAFSLAAETGKDPRVVELILQESEEIVRKRDGLIIARHRNGCVAANACIDLSNAGGNDIAVLLPVDPDRSARKIAEDILAKTGVRVGVIINDSLGRAWRVGTTGTAIGAYGITTIHDRRGAVDRAGNVLQTSEIAIADEVAGAASLLMGQGDEGLPMVVVRGLDWASGAGKAADLVRPPELDLFR